MKLSTKKIYLIRHGQTDYNKRGIVQGSGVDTSLNEYGREQARAFFEKYKGIPFDRIYTSALKRSQESVRMFIETGIPLEVHSGLNEINWGNKEGQPITPEEDEYYHYILDQWKEGNIELQIQGGESPVDVTNRLIPVVDKIKSRESENTILICMHGRAMRILLCYLLDYPLTRMDNFEHTNLGLYIVNYTNGGFAVELANDTSHLEFLS